MKHNFKPGDPARMTVDVINKAGVQFTKGQIVTVVAKLQSCTPYLVKNEDDDYKYLKADQIEPINPPEFQVGDTVYDNTLFPGPDPNVPNPGKVVEIGTDPYPICVYFNGEIVFYTTDSRYHLSYQPTLSKTPYRFVREEIKWQPKRGEAVLYSGYGVLCAGVFTDMVVEGYRVATFNSSIVAETVYPFDPDKVGKAVKP